MIEQINLGTQSRVGIKISGSLVANSSYTIIRLGDDEAYYITSAAVSADAKSAANANFLKTFDGTSSDLVSAINRSSKNFWAMLENGVAYIFAKKPGDGVSFKAEEIGNSATVKNNVTFINLKSDVISQSGAEFTLGGEHWARMEVSETGGGRFAAALVGRDIGDDMNLRIAGTSDLTDLGTAIKGVTSTTLLMKKLIGDNFVQLQDSADGEYDGSHVRTQEAGQEALDAVNEAIEKKDKIRAHFGQIAERLEAAIESMTVQAENIQIAESRISDVDVATEMTEFTKNNIMVQAATSMLAQANSLSSLVLTLLR
jgi:flagellin-like hook-associated protein FlgL